MPLSKNDRSFLAEVFNEKVVTAIIKNASKVHTCLYDEDEKKLMLYINLVGSPLVEYLNNKHSEKMFSIKCLSITLDYSVIIKDAVNMVIPTRIYNTTILLDYDDEVNEISFNYASYFELNDLKHLLTNPDESIHIVPIPEVEQRLTNNSFIYYINVNSSMEEYKKSVSSKIWRE